MTKTYMMLIGLALTVTLSAFATHKIDRHFFDIEKADALTAQAQTLTKQHNEKLAQVEAASNVYQENIATLNTDLAAAKRLFGRSCITVSPDGGRGSDGASGVTKPISKGRGSDQTIVNAGAILDLFAEGERYRAQVIGLQAYVKTVCVQP